MLHIAPTVSLKSPIKLTGWKSEYPEMTGSWRKLSSAGIIFKKHKSSSEMSVSVTLMKIRPDVIKQKSWSGFTNCFTVLFWLLHRYVWRTDDFIDQLHVCVVLQWQFNKTPYCVLFTHHCVLTPTILPFQLNRQYISGRHVSLPMHPFISHWKTYTFVPVKQHHTFSEYLALKTKNQVTESKK